MSLKYLKWEFFFLRIFLFVMKAQKKKSFTSKNVLIILFMLKIEEERTGNIVQHDQVL